MSIEGARGPNYRPYIDGLRAVAVMAVLFYHARIPGFSGGFVGVDIFFVISGYLITGIIHGELEQGRFAVLGFYDRRIRRIIPALVFMLIAVGMAATVILLPQDLAAYGRSALAALFSVSNFFFIRAGGYFAPVSELQPLLHTWSLGVEEQFYLVFPPSLALLFRYQRKAVIPVLCAVLLASLAISVVLTPVHPGVAFYSSPTRAWELMIGGILAVGSLPAISRPLREIVSVAGATALVCAITLYNRATPFPGFAALLPCLGAAALLYAGGKTAIGRLLSTRPFLFVGLISYSLYLWHWPLLAFGRYLLMRELDVPEALGILTIAFVMAVISWRFVERPFRNRMRLRSRKLLFGTAAAVIASVAFISLPMLSGMPSRFSPRVLAAANETLDFAGYRDRCINLPSSEVRAGRPCVLGAKADATVLLWGDSHADAISPAVDQVAKRLGLGAVNASHISCPPALDVDVDVPPTVQTTAVEDCRAWNNAVVAYLHKSQIKTVVLEARWALYADGTGYGPDVDERVSLGRNTKSALLTGLRRTFGALAGKRVILVLSVPEAHKDVPFAVAQSFRGLPAGRIGPSAVEYRSRQAIIEPELRALAREYGAQVADPASILCDETCQVALDGIPFYYDGNHLSTFGARQLTSLFSDALTQPR
jgi:peptidoglycan/LPS O-acetylase OafA/YrhL